MLIGLRKEVVRVRRWLALLLAALVLGLLAGTAIAYPNGPIWPEETVHTVGYDR